MSRQRLGLCGAPASGGTTYASDDKLTVWGPQHNLPD